LCGSVGKDTLQKQQHQGEKRHEYCSAREVFIELTPVNVFQQKAPPFPKQKNLRKYKNKERL